VARTSEALNQKSEPKRSALRQIRPLEKSHPWQRRFQPWAIPRRRTFDSRVCISPSELAGLAAPLLHFPDVADATRSRNSPWKHGRSLSRGREAPAPRTVHPSRSAESPSERAVQGVNRDCLLRETKFFRWEGS